MPLGIFVRPNQKNSPPSYLRPPESIPIRRLQIAEVQAANLDREFDSIADGKLTEDRLNVVLDGLFREDQTFSDLPVGVSGGD